MLALRLQLCYHGGEIGFQEVGTMPQLTVRNIDEQVYRRLKDRARINRRSLEAEVRTILDQAALPDRTEVVKRANEFRQRLVGRYIGDATAEIRADRDR